MAFPFVCDLDLSKIHFAPHSSDDGKEKVEVFVDQTKRKLKFSLCEDAMEPFETRFPLDGMRDDSNNERRGQMICLKDEKVLAQFRALDELVLKTAFERSKEWFKGKQLTMEELKFRYQPLVCKGKEEDDFFCTKFKVKCPPAKVPTALHLLKQSGDECELVDKGCSLDQLSAAGGKMAPLLYVYSIWFMGGGRSFGLTVQAEEIVVQPGVATNPLSKFQTKRKVTMVSASDDATGDEPVAKSVKVELEGDGPM